MKRPWLGRKGALLPQRRQRVEDFLGHGRVSTSSAVGAQAPCDAMQCYAGRKSVWKIAAKWITFFLSQTGHFPLFRARRAPQAAYESAKFLSFWLRDDDLMHSVKLPPFNQTRRATLPTRTTDLWNLPKVAATAARQAALATPVTIPASEAEWYQTENARGWCCRADSQRSKPLLSRDSSWNRHARFQLEQTCEAHMAIITRHPASSRPTCSARSMRRTPDSQADPTTTAHQASSRQWLGEAERSGHLTCHCATLPHGRGWSRTPICPPAPSHTKLSSPHLVDA